MEKTLISMIKYKRVILTREEVIINMANKKVKTSGRKSKQREIEQKRKKIILIITLALVAIIGICAYLLISPSFNIQEIIITGNSQVTNEEIYEISEIKIGDNIFKTLEIVAKVRLKQNGYIEDVILHKTYPNKIEIEIKEREKSFQVRTETGCYIYIDEQGYILDYSLDKLELITIMGMEINESGIEEKRRLEENDLDKMENILQIREECRNIQIADKITQIQVKDEYIINLGNEEIFINLGDATSLKDRMYYVNAILKEEVEKKGTIYINGSLNEGFSPYFKSL